MAEAVAAAASVAGLASLAIQLTESVATLRRFYRSVRNASDTLEELVAELETITLALLEVERDVQRNDAVGSYDLLDRCVKSCERGAKKLRDVVDKMTRLQTKAKGLGQLYIAIKEKDEQGILVDLERAKSSLAFAFQMYSEARRRVDSERQTLAMQQLGQQLMLLPQEVALEMHQALPGVYTDTTKQTDDARNEEPASLSTVRHHRGGKQKSSGFHLRIPAFFWQRVWHVAAARSLGGWHVSLQSQRIRPIHAPVFDMVSANDLRGVQRLFTAGEASPFDCTGYGDSLLELAGLNGSVDVVRYLLAYFRFPDIDDIVRNFAMGIFEHNDHNSNACRTEMFRAYLDQGSFDPLECFSNDANYGMWKGICQFSTPDCVDIFLHSLPLPLPSLPFQLRFECAVHMETRHITPAQFLRVCGINKVSTELASSKTSRGITALHVAIRAILNRWGLSTTDLGAWVDFATRLVLHGADLHQGRVTACITPLVMFFDELRKTGGDRLETIIRMIRFWVSLLEQTGVDLLAYGAVESSLLAEYRDRYYECFVVAGYCLVEIEYGKKASDWSLNIRLFGEVPFYKKGKMPGTWPDELVPDRIAWLPHDFQDDGGQWQEWDGGLGRGTYSELYGTYISVVFGAVRPIAEVVGEATYSPVEEVITGTQDDHGIVSFLGSRPAPANGARSRSQSQPPPAPRRRYAHRTPRPSTYRKGQQTRRLFYAWHLYPSSRMQPFGCAVEFIERDERPLRNSLIGIFGPEHSAVEVHITNTHQWRLWTP